VSTPGVLALQAALLIAWAGAAACGRRLPRVARIALLAALALAALYAHVDPPRYHGRGTPVQWHDFFHYYVATKYHAELGYTRLYEAATVADALDAPDVLRRAPEIRALEDYWMEGKESVLARSAAIAAPFSEERWRAFRADVAVFRARDPERWAREILQDHGYNGPPLLTGLLGALASQPWLATERFVQLAAAADLAIVLATAAAIAAWLGVESGLAFLFFFGANPLNDYYAIGGSYLRYLHLAATALAAAALARGSRAASGALFALSAHLRGLALVWVAALGAHQLLRGGRWSRLRGAAPFWLSFGGTAALLLVASLAVPYPEGGSAWSAFARKIALHGENLSVNCVGLRFPFMYSERANVPAVLRSWPAGERLNWIEEARATLAGRRAAFGVTAAALLALSLAVLWRARGEAPALLAAPLWSFAGLMLAHYDWAALAVVPLLYPGRADVQVALALGLALTAGARFLPGAAEAVDLRFAAASAATGLTLAAVAAVALRRDPAPPGGVE
jgi:hypothetical protein